MATPSFARGITACLVCCIALAGCARSANSVEVRALTDEEAGDLWASAVSNEPVGSVKVRTIDGGNGVTTVTATQAYRYRTEDGSSGGLVTVCGFSYAAPAGGGPESCAPSGCQPSGNTCTAESLGGCTVTQPCRPQSHVAIFGDATITAGSQQAMR